MLVGYSSESDSDDAPDSKRRKTDDSMQDESIAKPVNHITKVVLPSFNSVDGIAVRQTKGGIEVRQPGEASMRPKVTSALVPPQVKRGRKNISTEDVAQWNTQKTLEATKK